MQIKRHGVTPFAEVSQIYICKGNDIRGESHDFAPNFRIV